MRCKVYTDRRLLFVVKDSGERDGERQAQSLDTQEKAEGEGLCPRPGAPAELGRRKTGAWLTCALTCRVQQGQGPGHRRRERLHPGGCSGGEGLLVLPLRQRPWGAVAARTRCPSTAPPVSVCPLASYLRPAPRPAPLPPPGFPGAQSTREGKAMRPGTESQFPPTTTTTPAPPQTWHRQTFKAGTVIVLRIWGKEPACAAGGVTPAVTTLTAVFGKVEDGSLQASNSLLKDKPKTCGSRPSCPENQLKTFFSKITAVGVPWWHSG